jgi:hypothetical protein
VRLTVRLLLSDGTEQVVTSKPVDVVRWEKSTKSKIGDGMGLSDMAMIAHIAAKREGLTDLPFDAWLDYLEDFEPIGADEPDPSPPQPVAS